MIKKFPLKRAIGIGVLIYLASFVVGILTGALVGFDFTSSEIPADLYYIGVVSATVLMILFTLWFLRSSKVVANAKSGLYFGLVTIGVGFFFDTLLFLPVFLDPNSETDPILYYSDPLFWLTVVMVILAAVFVGEMLDKKNS